MLPSSTTLHSGGEGVGGEEGCSARQRPGAVLYMEGGCPVLSAWGTYFPREIGCISGGEPHGGLVREKLGHYCASNLPLRRDTPCLPTQRTIDTQLRVCVYTCDRSPRHHQRKRSI